MLQGIPEYPAVIGKALRRLFTSQYIRNGNPDLKMQHPGSVRDACASGNGIESDRNAWLKSDASAFPAESCPCQDSILPRRKTTIERCAPGPEQKLLPHLYPAARTSCHSQNPRKIINAHISRIDRKQSEESRFMQWRVNHTFVPSLREHQGHRCYRYPDSLDAAGTKPCDNTPSQRDVRPEFLPFSHEAPL